MCGLCTWCFSPQRTGVIQFLFLKLKVNVWCKHILYLSELKNYSNYRHDMLRKSISVCRVRKFCVSFWHRHTSCGLLCVLRLFSVKYVHWRSTARRSSWRYVRPVTRAPTEGLTALSSCWPGLLLLSFSTLELWRDCPLASMNMNRYESDSCGSVGFTGLKKENQNVAVVNVQNCFKDHKRQYFV